MLQILLCFVILAVGDYMSTVYEYNSPDKNLKISRLSSYPDKSTPITVFDRFVLLYILSGDVSYMVDGKNYLISSPSLMAFSPSEMHYAQFGNESNLFERVAITFEKQYFSASECEGYNLFDYIESRPPGTYNRINRKEMLELHLESILSGLDHYASSELPERNVMIKSLMINLLVSLNCIYQAKPSYKIDTSGYDPKISLITKFIEENYSSKITLKNLEETFYVSRHYLCHIFKKHTKMSVMEYLSMKRIIKAKEFLLSGLSATETAFKCGFGDYSNFFKTFKSVTGMSPKNYRGHITKR